MPATYSLTLSYEEIHLVDGELQTMQSSLEGMDGTCVACGADILTEDAHQPDCPVVRAEMIRKKFIAAMEAKSVCPY